MLNLTEIAKRIKNPELCTAADIDSLKLLCETYPFAQIFPLMYLKTLAKTNDVRLDTELQKYAYRIADRMVLYNLLHQQEIVNKNQVIESNDSTHVTNDVISTEIIQNNFDGNLETIKQEEHENSAIQITSDVVQQQTIEIENTVKTEINIQPENALQEEKIESHTIIEESEAKQEIIELADEVNDNQQENIELIQQVETISLQETQAEQEEIVELLPTLPDEYFNELNKEMSIYSLEVEEEKIAKQQKEEEKKRLIESLIKKPTHQVQETNERSFTAWLKQGNNTVSKPSTEQIIEQFIENKPKISPAKEKLFEDRQEKKELYNPIKKAKESLDESQLPVSETLAKIFAAQGNFPKAIYAYEQLMLIIPEKKLFFAGQIKELRKKINS